MKKLNYAYLAIFIITLLSSCGVNNSRIRYKKVRTNNQQAKLDLKPSSDYSIDLSSEKINNDVNNISASLEDEYIEITPSTIESMNDESCDVIIKRNGDEVLAKIIEIGINEIKFKKCNNLDGPIYSVLKDDIFMIKYSNGEKDVFKLKEKETPKKEPQKAEKAEPIANPTAHAGGVTGLVFGIIALAVGSLLFWSVWLLGIPAFILGIVAVSAKNRHPDKYKGKAAGVLAIIFGLIAIALCVAFIILVL